MSELLDKRPFDLEGQSEFPFMTDVPADGPRYRVGVIGATGAVGGVLVKVLRERRFPINEIRLFASPNSVGKWVETPFGSAQIENLNVRRPPHLDIAFLAAGASVARKWGWRLAHRGALVIDKSSYFRNKDYAPLIVPEVNESAVIEHRGIIANPNCTTIPLVMTLAPLHKRFGLRYVNVVSFQSVSGSGKRGITALARELTDNDATPSVFPQRIAYNVIPWIGDKVGRKSGEEVKMMFETRRILGLPRLPVVATAVRVPTLIGHALSIHAEFNSKVSYSAAIEALSAFTGLKILSDDEYPTPLISQGKDEVFVGRVRVDRGKSGLGLFVVTDNLRKGAATNAVQIAELLIAKLRSTSG